MMLSLAAHAAPKDDGPPPLTYQIVSVRLSGGGDEPASVLLEMQTGRSWILVQRGNAPPAWHSLAFESGFSLNQQLQPPELGGGGGDRR
jgi:hypothetical protein